ncbi:MAG TPA: CpsD/CapB family tyrosine-protein kinase [Oscillospiraceae bacterium]|nr:CpsD/CapB family tyrosine-protein kinase [Oscillospiraceae bacterium]HPF54925.1 CpsD/CapB family tyrosine-protein kinase [Clostridiales bacterium]HPK34984.1 CpsD/CapB family tyrosine-protein kinase [Oscillospiraceae bacterium]HPR75542.1 CpsD/CapB family tyrosine-protein kinase [Oscillospiraceae bacterium]
MKTNQTPPQNDVKNEHPAAQLSEYSIGKNLSFSASEAYKSLRTNLMYSFADYIGCRVIGITSTERFEGKTTTAINLAYSLMESGKKVLLMECDLRLPSFSGVLKIPSSPGLSNILINPGKNRLNALINYNGTDLFFLPAGDTPPNPAELLSSNAMSELIKFYSSVFEYIILDLPPTLAVTDAPIVSKYTNGIIFVVRHNVTDSLRLRDSMNRLSLVGARIFGFVYNCNPRSENKYSKRYINSYLKQQSKKSKA